MTYELWDMDTGYGLARFDSDQAMAELVDGLVAANGKSLAVHLSLIIAEPSG